MILPPIPCISSPSDLDGPAYLERISWSHIIKGPCVSVEGVLSLSFGGPRATEGCKPGVSLLEISLAVLADHRNQWGGGVAC